ncbi:hypothetical protein [Thermomonospora amylolytica]|uniref:hypothetical protein n=1 Tax=Thermomonospora amylolytica TaxID=1411117 RepID=UPI000E6BD44E|nr:hypothetical protein [Thermomonospora amylolytica]
MTDLTAICGASTTGLTAGPIGPCILRAGHDGPIHQAADGVRWIGTPGQQITVPAMAPEDVPADLIEIVADIMFDDAHENCGEEPCPGNTRPWHEEQARTYLAAVLPAHEAMVRAKVADELRADADAHRSLVTRKPSEHDAARLARARTLDDAATRITRGRQ